MKTIHSALKGLLIAIAITALFGLLPFFVPLPQWLALPTLFVSIPLGLPMFLLESLRVKLSENATALGIAFCDPGHIDPKGAPCFAVEMIYVFIEIGINGIIGAALGYFYNPKTRFLSLK